jgi:hypothetical protein
MGYWDTFAAARLRRRLFMAAFMLLLGGALMEINILSERHYRRFGASKCYAIGDECVTLAKKIGEQLQLCVVCDEGDSFSDGDSPRPALRIFLENAKAALARGGVNFSYDFVSLAANGKSMEQWFGECRPQMQPSSGIFLRAGDKLRELCQHPSCAIGDWTSGDSAFERSLVSALRSLADGEQKTICFLRGHGERSLQRRSGDGGLSRMCQWVLRQGWQVAQIDGENIGEIGGANSLVAIVDPRLPLRKREQAALLSLLEEKRGRILILLTPDSHPSTGNFLYHWNVLADPPSPIATGDDRDDGVRICRFSAAAPYLRPIIDLQQPVQFDSVRRICEDEGGPLGGHVRVEPLLESSPSHAAKAQTVAVSVENYSVPDGHIGIVPWKMVVVGGDFLANRHFALPGNQLLFQQLLFYLFDSEINAEFPRREELQINLTNREMHSLARTCIFLPLIFPAIMLLIRTARRRG